MIRVIAVLLLAGLAHAEEIDLLKSRDRWLTHPVLGGPVFDGFEAAKNNPIYRGSMPYEWPVNGTLFIDPVSGNWYAYIGRYLRNYAMQNESPMHCIVLRSTDQGATWEDLGRVLPPDPPITYPGELSPALHAPDVQVIFADGKYHACFDWCTASTNWENAANPGPDANSGVGYAWAERPEGPWHVSEKPITTTRDMKLLHGKYRRLYASSMVRRKNDWLVLTDVDSGPHFGWGVVGMTAERPEGPYSEPKLLLSCEGETYHPPLLEFFPCHVSGEGRLYLPATSVAKNRAVQGLFSVALEEAMEPTAWHLERLNCPFTPSASEYDRAGIWGQAYSLAMPMSGPAAILYPSRDGRGMGTINIARAREVMSQEVYVGGSNGPSLAVIPIAGNLRELKAKLAVTGNVTLYWGMTAPLGPDAPRSDASIASVSLTGCTGINFCDCGEWKLVEVPLQGKEKVIASDTLADASAIELEMAYLSESETTVRLGGVEVYRGPLQGRAGNLGVAPKASSFGALTEFSITTEGAAPACITWMAEEGLLGGAQSTEAAQWNKVSDPMFRFGNGYVSAAPTVRGKWNVSGSDIALWSPRGPMLGRGEVVVDGASVAVVDLHAEAPTASGVVYKITSLAFGRHAVVFRPVEGAIALDSLDVFSVPGL